MTICTVAYTNDYSSRKLKKVLLTSKADYKIGFDKKSSTDKHKA